MTKTDLIAAVAEKAGLKKADADKAVNAVLESIQESLVKGEKVALIGFGTFETRVHAAKKGINPQTKKEIKIPEKKVPAFKAGKALKEIVDAK